MKVCAAFPLGASDLDSTGNTIGCRTYHANASATDPTTHCPHAGPTGGNFCGTYCEAYCNMTAAACTGQFADFNFCNKSCSLYSTTGKLGDTSGANLYCKLYHVQAALAGNATLHCPHSSAAGYDYCGSRCENYCHIIGQTCTGAHAQFSAPSECPVFCESIRNGTVTDTAANSIECIIYHALAASVLNDPTTHCPHASPSGGNTCGSWCDVYCELVDRICVGTEKIFDNDTACHWQCPKYSNTATPGVDTGDSVQCRIYHLGEGHDDPAESCSHGGINGGGTCVGGTPSSSSGASSTSGNSESSGANVIICLFALLIVTLILF